jgi:hypothetical protein
MNSLAKLTPLALGGSLDLFYHAIGEAGEILRLAATMELITQLDGERHHLGVFGEV